MVRWSLLVAFVLAASVGCRAESSAPAPPPPPLQTGAAAVETQPETTAPAAIAESETDRGIRHDLDLAIRSDPNLKARQISFLVTNGDVSVSGVVKDEHERKRINELAMGISGVKSVANALRISD